MENNPLVSVIIPTYNREYCLLKSINSVLGQTYSNIELIVVDDCSTDGTIQLLESIQDPRLRVFVQERNSGPASARNFGVKMARGDYIAFHDSDDECHLDKIEKQLRFMLGNPNVDFCFHKMARYKNHLFFDFVPTLNADDFNVCPSRFELYANYVGAPCVMVKKTFFEKIGGFDSSMPNLEDWDLGINASLNGNVKYMDEVLLDVNISEGSITYNFEYQLRSMIIIIKKYIGRIKDCERTNYILKMFACFELNRFQKADQERLLSLIKKELYPDYIHDLAFFDLYELVMISNVNATEINKLRRYKCVSQNLLETDGRIGDWFLKKNYKNVVIYGMGRLGRCLADKLENKSINVIYGIDAAKETKYKELPILSMDEFNRLDCNVDCIIITPFNSVESIKAGFDVRYQGLCLSIEDILKEE